MQVKTKYLRLIRFKDLYLVIGTALISGLVIREKPLWILAWALALFLISIPVFIINELTDSQDTDKYTWNPNHIFANDHYSFTEITLLFIFPAALGLLISIFLNLFYWCLATLIIGILYSLKPIRLKARFILDWVAQSVVFWILPFLAPLSVTGYLNKAADVIIPVTILCLTIFFPYQLADYEADKKAGLKNTQTILGVHKSLIFAFYCGIAGILSFFGSGIYHRYTWLWPMLFAGIFATYKFYIWKNTYTKYSKEFQKDMIAYVKLLKPISLLYVPYLLIYFLFT